MTKVRTGSNGKNPLQGRHQRRGLEAGKSVCVREEVSTKNKLISGGRLVRGQAAPRGCPEAQSWVNWRAKKSPASRRGSVLSTAACRPDPRLQENRFLLACLSVCDSTPHYGDSLGPDLVPPFPGCWDYKRAPLGTASRKDFWQNLLICV